MKAGITSFLGNSFILKEIKEDIITLAVEEVEMKQIDMKIKGMKKAYL